MQCKNFKGIKLLEVGLEVSEKVMDKRLIKVVTIGDAQFASQPEKRTIGCNVYFEAIARESLGEEGKTVCYVFTFGKGLRPNTQKSCLLVHKETRNTGEISKNS